MKTRLFGYLLVYMTMAHCTGLAESKATTKSPKIVIVGAGIAGLAAGSHFEEESDLEDYFILEASDRVGGRMKTIFREQDGIKFPLELGATWIHGTVNNPIYDLANENTLFIHNDWSNEEDNPRFYEYLYECRYSDGSLLPQDLFRKVWSIINTASDEAYEFYNDGLPTGYSESSSIQDYMLNEFYKKTNGSYDDATWLKMRKAYQALLDYMTWDEGSHSMDEISLKYYGSSGDLGESDVTLPGGYITLIDAIKKRIPSDKIKLNHVVEKIEYSSNNPSVTVRCRNGQVFTADNVIVTTSLGYLKDKASTMFSPALPAKKMAAIQRLGFGTADRIYLEFPNLDFIENPEVGEIRFARMPDDLLNPSEWWKKVFVCYVQDVPKGNYLTCWLSGKQAEFMETQPDEVVKTKMRELLEQFLGTTVPAPINMIRSRWHNEEFVKGVYSGIILGSTPEDIKVLAEPIYFDNGNMSMPIIMFAGEATHEKYFATVHGAYLSGIREANRLVNSALQMDINGILLLLMALLNIAA